MNEDYRIWIYLGRSPPDQGLVSVRYYSVALNKWKVMLPNSVTQARLVFIDRAPFSTTILVLVFPPPTKRP